jgi:hypothetical protein
MPCSLVTSVRLVVVSAADAVTVTPGNGAPDESVTITWIVPVVTAPIIAPADAMRMQKKTTESLFMHAPFVG